jgi:hypothetical protein
MATDALLRKLALLRDRFVNRTQNSAFIEIVAPYLETIEIAQSDPNIVPATVNILEKQIGTLLELLPMDLGDRYYFDAELIERLRQEYFSQGFKLAGCILPHYGSDWRHIQHSFPATRQGGFRLVFIELPTMDDLDHVALEDYGFLFHELGHEIFLATTTRIENTFDTFMEEFLHDQRARLETLSLSPSNRESLDLLEECWTGRGGQNWFHELASDALGIWQLGPLYLESLLRQILAHSSFQALHEVKPGHPPINLRYECCLAWAERLCWPACTLDSSKELWSKIKNNSKDQPDNQYRSLTDPILLEPMSDAISSIVSRVSKQNMSYDLLQAIKQLSISSLIKLPPNLWIVAASLIPLEEREAFNRALISQMEIPATA